MLDGLDGRARAHLGWVAGGLLAAAILATAGLFDRSDRGTAAIESFRDCGDCPEMVAVPAGRFMMGSPPGVGNYDEYPQHEVIIAKPFAVAKFEATFAEWDACVAAGGCKLTPEDNGWGRDRRPVTNVSWDDTRDYLAWLSGRTGKRYRLLTEAEWEYAARAGSATPYPWGDDIGEANANCRGCGSEWDWSQTAPVGSFPANAFGLHDMVGNVLEWCEDAWHQTYDGAPADGSAFAGGDTGLRTLRGGSWVTLAVLTRPAYRDKSQPFDRSYVAGFRVARDLE
jgi:formylglycine-generating enzyme required for sulfatase activity